MSGKEDREKITEADRVRKWRKERNEKIKNLEQNGIELKKENEMLLEKIASLEGELNELKVVDKKCEKMEERIDHLNKDIQTLRNERSSLIEDKSKLQEKVIELQYENMKLNKN